MRKLLLVALTLAPALACEKSGKSSQSPDGTTAALPTKEEGERLEQIRAALRYRRGAEQRGTLGWNEGENGRAPALLGMYLQGSEDLGELTLVRVSAKKAEASISILARGSGAASKCKVELTIGGKPETVRSRLERNAPPPEGLRVEVDKLHFEIDQGLLSRLASSPDTGGSACGLAFSLTRSQRDRLDRAATLFAAGQVDETAIASAQETWDSDRLPNEEGGFRELGSDLGAATTE